MSHNAGESCCEALHAVHTLSELHVLFEARASQCMLKQLCMGCIALSNAIVTWKDVISAIAIIILSRRCALQAVPIFVTTRCPTTHCQTWTASKHLMLLGSASSPVAMTLFHGETHTLATTAGKIIIYTLATTLSSAHSSGNPRLARTGSGKAPLHGQDPHGGEDQSQIDEVQSQLEQLVDLLEQYFHPSNNGRSVGHNLMQRAGTECPILAAICSLRACWLHILPAFKCCTPRAMRVLTYLASMLPSLISCQKRISNVPACAAQHVAVQRIVALSLA